MAGLLTVIVATVACGVRSGDITPDARNVHLDEDQVAAAALDHLIAESGGRLALVETTASALTGPARSDRFTAAAAAAELLDESAASDFEIRNATVRTMTIPVGARPSLVLIDAASASAALSSVEGWNAFRVEHGEPAGIAIVSRPGFDRESTRAVLLVETRCGPGCGTGRMLALERTGGAWRVTAERTLWLA